MASYNRVILVGNLTRDPELSYTPSNTAICKFGMATNRRWRDQQGEMQEEVCFVDCTIFGRQAETLNQYVRKGQPLLIEGRLHFSQWTNQEGQRRSKLDVVAERFQFVGARGVGEGDRPAAAPAPQQAGGPRPEPFDAGTPPPPSDDYGPPPANVDGDIPF